MDDKIFPSQKTEEEILSEESDSAAIPPEDIVVYTELRSAADLVRMYNSGDLIIDPEFQREVVWNTAEQTRFLDSLIKQLPIPSLCLSLDYKTQTWQVIDGLQRLSTIIKFLNSDIKGNHWRLSKLKDVDERISGKLTSEFFTNDEFLSKCRRTVENVTLPITVLRCDYSKESHKSYIFEIFKRLNTGGEKLKNQEVRNCVYSGPFNTLLNKAVNNTDFLRIQKWETPRNHRYQGQEFLLRFFAFRDEYESYGGKLATFLNDYMCKHQYATEAEISAFESSLNQTLSIAGEKLGDELEGRSQALKEATLVGIARNLPTATNYTKEELLEKLSELENCSEFSAESLSEGISKRDRVIGRMNSAERIFA